MATRTRSHRARAVLACLLLAAPPVALDVAAQTLYPPPTALAPAPPSLLGRAELQQLVAPIALYPDSLLAIVLPATRQPLQVVQAARFREAAATDPTLSPPAEWDDAVVALLNYPDVLTLLDRDLDWTSRLGQAMTVQEADVLAAVADFRNQVARAGNLRNDGRQVIGYEGDALTIRPANPQVIYVPVYEPARVLVYQSTPAYGYYPYPYPVYYDPYPRYFRSGFWGLTSAFGIGWGSHSLFVRHHHDRHHPYYGHRYDDRRYYRHRRDHDGHVDRRGGGRGDWRDRNGHRDDHYSRRDERRPDRADRADRRGTRGTRQAPVLGAQARPPAAVTGNGFVRDGRRGSVNQPAQRQAQTPPFGFVRDAGGGAGQGARRQAQAREQVTARSARPSAPARPAQTRALQSRAGFGRNAEALANLQREAAARDAPVRQRFAPQAAVRQPRAARNPAPAAREGMRAARGVESQAARPARSEAGFSRNASRSNRQAGPRAEGQGFNRNGRRER